MLLEPRNVDAVFLAGDVAHLRGDFAASEREYVSVSGVAQSEADRSGARVRLGWLYLTQGRFEEAREQVQAATVEGKPNETLGWVELETSRPDLAVKTFNLRLVDPASAADPADALHSLFGLALSYVAVGDIVRAQKALDDLKVFPEGVFVKPKNRMSLSLSGALAAKRGDGRAAVADLERAASMLPYQVRFDDEHAGMFDLLARGYEVAGDPAKARETYQKITALTTGRQAYGATYARSVYHLGLIAERQGDKARARTQFQKFLDLWKNADPGQREVADAKKRIAQ